MHTVALARALVEGGYEVAVCAYHEHDPLMVREVEGAGARVRLLGLERRRGLRGMLRLARALRRVFREERPHFAHVQYMTPGVAPILTARLCRAPRVLATVHVPGRHYGRHIWLPRVAARLCDVFLCVSETAERSFFGDSALFEESLLRAGRRHFTIHNAVDLDEADAIIASGRGTDRRRELGLDGHPVVGVVGRLSHEKGHAWLLEAMRGVVERLPDARLLIVGDGAERPALETQAARLALDGHVIWTGRLPREEALECYTAMDVAAVPSLWEGFGLTAAEAMAFSKPVVASDVDGLREVVQNGETGLLSPCQDAEAMTNALLSVLGDGASSRTFGQASRARAEKLFSQRAFAARHLKLYRSFQPKKALCPRVSR